MSRSTSSQRTARVLAALLVPLALTITTIVTTTAAQASGAGPGLGRVKEATAKFHRVRTAERAGYGRFVDVNGIACIDMPGMGAMGVHYVDQSLVGDGEINARKPEAVIYEPVAGGHLRLVAVEYLVVQSQWLAHHSGPPTLFGQTFNFTASPNRFGLPAFYSLHAWVWKHNPAGTFAMWNPRVQCPE